MFWIWAWAGLVLVVVVAFFVYHFVRAHVERLKEFHRKYQAEIERFETHRAKELWDLERLKERERHSVYERERHSIYD
jgi:peptidoglycan/LPS O-acetylase OafA/YrhL